MSCAERLQSCLTAPEIGLPVFPKKYTGELLHYIVWNYTTIPDLHAGNVANAARYLVQVHYFLPDKENPNPTLEKICKALVGARFTSPEIVDAAERNGQHYVMECEGTDRGYIYGDC